MRKFGVVRLTEMLEERGIFRVSNKSERRINCGKAILLYGCTGANGDTLIVNKSEKARIQNYLDDHPHDRPWVMRLEAVDSYGGLHAFEDPTAVVLVPLAMDKPLSAQLTPSATRSHRDRREIVLSALTFESLRDAVQAPLGSDSTRHLDDKTLPTEVRREVWMRTNAGAQFRHRIVAAYPPACAFCGFAQKEVLQAAHIIPWARATSAQRTATDNGILLCPSCHALFDAELVILNSDFSLTCQLTHQHGATFCFKGKRMVQPIEARDQPSSANIYQKYAISS